MGHTAPVGHTAGLNHTADLNHTAPVGLTVHVVHTAGLKASHLWVIQQEMESKEKAKKSDGDDISTEPN